jgi:hypothetical protein
VHGKNASPQRIMLTLVVDDVKASFDKALSLGATAIAEPYRPQEDNEVLSSGDMSRNRGLVFSRHDQQNGLNWSK